MPRVVALYRYPVKGFTPEPCTALTVLPEGRVAGDRVLAFRFANAPVADDQWCRKYEGIVLANTPGLARLSTQFDHHQLRLKISLDAQVLADEGLDEAGRKRMVEALTAYVLDLREHPLRNHPDRLPLKLIGDGVTPRYQDNQAGQVTLHSRETIASAATALREPKLSEHRFRSNIAIEGVEAWAEQSWLGRSIRIGGVEFDVVKPKTRCLATHANPLTGERDLTVMQGLMRSFAQKESTLGVGMLTRGAGGEIHVGDSVSVIS
ncbi:MAG: MOSC domain-containing protein [Burkholderiales bacterium]|nr:MOSC domain-containing protein [Burkholderiales bacterium]MDP2397617.1 MOSC domain-containing protein [Burkholderiales bacterium]MDP3715296.1 MOSC domain-containing protein [Burkholderiales bacterium]